MGDEIDFAVPQDRPICGEAAKAIFTGRPLGLIASGTCAAGDRPLQNVVLVDPNRGGGTVTAIVTSRTEPVAAGTQLEQFVPLGLCDGADGTRSDKFRGTVVR